MAAPEFRSEHKSQYAKLHLNILWRLRWFRSEHKSQYAKLTPAADVASGSSGQSTNPNMLNYYEQRKAIVKVPVRAQIPIC